MQITITEIFTYRKIKKCFCNFDVIVIISVIRKTQEMNKSEVKMKFDKMKQLQNKLQEIGAIPVAGDPDRIWILQGTASQEDIQRIVNQFNLEVAVQFNTENK